MEGFKLGEDNQVFPLKTKQNTLGLSGDMMGRVSAGQVLHSGLID